MKAWKRPWGARLATLALVATGFPLVVRNQTQLTYPEIGLNERRPGNIAHKDRDGTHGDRYRLRVTGPGRLTVTLRSERFDAYLMIHDAETGILLCADDDGAGGTDARCELRLTDNSTRVFVLTARPYSPSTGSYTLTTEFGARSPSPPASSPCPAAHWELTGFESDPFANGCRQADGSIVRRYAFQVYRGQLAVIELIAPAGAETQVRLKGPSGEVSSDPRRIRAFLPEGSYELEVRRSATSPAGRYLVRTHGDCATNLLRLGETVSGRISPADCRVREFLDAGVVQGDYARRYEFELKERSRCRVTCTADGRGCYSATGETGRAVSEASLVLPTARHSFYVVAGEDLMEARPYRLRHDCSPAPCPWQSLAAGDDLEGQFSEGDCRLCDYLGGADCDAPAHGYAVASDGLPLRIETSPSEVSLLDMTGGKLSNPLLVQAPYRFLVVFNRSYRIRAVASPPPCSDIEIRRLLGAQSPLHGPCGVLDREPDSETTNIPLDESCRLAESNTFVRLFRFTLLVPGRFQVKVVPRGFTGPRLLLTLRCGREQVEADNMLDRVVPPGVHVLAVSSRNPTFGRFDLITRFRAREVSREGKP